MPCHAVNACEQVRNTAGVTLSRKPQKCKGLCTVAHGILAETEGFEPSVGVIPLRRFSKPLVSATHPRLRAGAGRAITVGPGGGKGAWEGNYQTRLTPNQTHLAARSLPLQPQRILLRREKVRLT
jgi:hypothetical protein